MAASRLTICFAAFVALCSPALAAKTCIIVWSPGTNGDANEKFWHEQAHCWNWRHPTKLSMFGKAFQVPHEYRLKGEYPNWTSPCGKKACTVKKAKQLCGGHFGCQYFR